MDNLPILQFVKNGSSPNGGLTAPTQFAVPTPPPPGYYKNLGDLVRQFTIRDIGPDVQSRFTYRAVCVALYAIVALLNDDPKHVAVYCEVLEDFLLEGADGRYAVVQVKTRERDREPFKTSDEEVLSTLYRFSEYEHCKGARFYRYVIATNAGFWKEKRNWKNLHHIKKVTSGDARSFGPDVVVILGKIRNAVGDERNIEQDVLAEVLRKLELDNELPTLGAERDALRNALVRYLGTPTVREIDYVVSDLVEYVRNHSDRSLEERNGIRRVLAVEPQNADIQARLASRKITREALASRLSAAIRAAAALEEERKRTATIDINGLDREKITFGFVERGVWPSSSPTQGNGPTCVSSFGLPRTLVSHWIWHNGPHKGRQIRAAQLSDGDHFTDESLARGFCFNGRGKRPGERM